MYLGSLCERPERLSLPIASTSPYRKRPTDSRKTPLLTRPSGGKYAHLISRDRRSSGNSPRQTQRASIKRSSKSVLVSCRKADCQDCAFRAGELSFFRETEVEDELPDGRRVLLCRSRVLYTLHHELCGAFEHEARECDDVGACEGFCISFVVFDESPASRRPGE
jgi:hypothetical protein